MCPILNECPGIMGKLRNYRKITGEWLDGLKRRLHESAIRCGHRLNMEPACMQPVYTCTARIIMNVIRHDGLRGILATLGTCIWYCGLVESQIETVWLNLVYWNPKVFAAMNAWTVVVCEMLRQPRVETWCPVCSVQLIRVPSSFLLHQPQLGKHPKEQCGFEKFRQKHWSLRTFRLAMSNGWNKIIMNIK